MADLGGTGGGALNAGESIGGGGGGGGGGGSRLPIVRGGGVSGGGGGMFVGIFELDVVLESDAGFIK